MGSFHLPIWNNKARNCKPEDLTKHQRGKNNNNNNNNKIKNKKIYNSMSSIPRG